ncbi:MAG: anti-sigma factor [Pseudomonadota bacterium]
MKYTDPTLLDALAARYALGTMRGRARQRFERLMRERADVMAQVVDWERRLEALDPPAGETPAPPARVWHRIVDRLGHAPNDELASRRQRQRPKPARPSAFTALAAGIAALLLVSGTWFVAQQVQPPSEVLERAPAYVSVIANADGADVWLVQVYDDPAQLRVRVNSAPTPLDDRVYELWMLPDDGVPVSLGLLPTFGALRTQVSAVALDALARSANLAVSTEPPGGSPTGQPTGDVVFVAPLARAEI